MSLLPGTVSSCVSLREQKVRPRKSFKIIVVDGLIGSGKTTFIPKFIEWLETKHGKKCIYVEEPVDEWKSSGMLEKFYSNIKQNAYMFHVYTLTTIYNIMKQKIKEAENIGADVIVCERSIFSVRHMFAESLIELGFFTPTQINDFEEVFKRFRDDLPAPDLFVWLDTPLGICMERIQARNRGNETAGIKEDYQKALWKNHSKFFEDPNFEYKYVTSPQIYLDYLHKVIRKSEEEEFMDHAYNAVFSPHTFSQKVSKK